MKTRIILFTAAIIASGLFSHLSAQEEMENRNGNEQHKFQISDIQNNVVTIEDSDKMSESHRKIEVQISSEYGKFTEYGKSLYTQHRWKKENRKIGYDFSQFPDGVYIIEIFNKRQLVCSKVIEKRTSIQSENQVAIQLN